MSEQGKSELTVEEAKRLIIHAAATRENQIVVRHIEHLTVHIPGRDFQGIEAYVAKDAIDELVDAGDAEEVSFNGTKAHAYRISEALLKKIRATKDASE